MISKAYRERAALDLEGRIKKVTVNDINVPIKSITRSSNAVTVITDRSPTITQIKSVKIFDENNALITERSSQVDVRDSITLDFRFTFEVI
ncbi:hypothetical protein [Listeria booriae]|uniref:Uncharacterized protein n=1 Tax=Listeria booriae TaxID=1552123 RepID=A0A842EYQ5_9LIST|nr:hypothetical protein [Listeria booriae]MBC1209460.1 hypothetical protein [Listeria booriae]MBC2004457.1 hypothetical protein [Listeria booriae]MBC2158755.1 hypothetical protein [Listeria booriae]MBC2241804.1 hypothetical protein [Listeria booriae]MBC2369967.1 hypothetical protein [Listeria booriae]